MTLEIRKAVEADIPEIFSITREAFEKYARDLGLPHAVSALKETYETIQRDLKTKTILIALLDGIPVGSVRFEVLPGNIAYVSRFGVKLDIQNCGVGKALISAVEKEAREMGLDALTLHTAAKMTALVRFYYGLGFYIHSTTTDRGYIRALLCRDLTENTSTCLEAAIGM